MSDLDDRIATIVDYWLGFDQTDPQAFSRQMRRWFIPSPDVDREIESRFGELVAAAARESLGSWERSARGRLALIILLDQFPRNLFRGTPAAFVSDPLALAQTLQGMDEGLDRELEPLERAFFYMPMQHSESAPVQQRSVGTFRFLSEQPVPEGLAKTLGSFVEYAKLHRDIIASYGRFPHRNKVLGRTSTSAEEAFLKEGGPTFGQ